MATLESAEKLGPRLSFDTTSNIAPNAIGPRLGCLSVPGREDLYTPNFFAIGSRGVVPHLAPDVISASTQFGGVHMALEDFLERAPTGTPPIMKYPGLSPIHGFTTLPVPLISLLAPRRTPAISAPRGNSNTSTAIYIFTSTGFQALSSKAYTMYVNRLRPDIAIGLADITYGSRPGVKRLAKMGDRTEDWLSEMLRLKNSDQTIFAPVLPVDFHSQAEYLNFVADELAEQISGLAFYDSNLLPDIPATTAIARLPRLTLDEPTSPRHILRQISLGMDIFTIPFVGFATDAGIALTFRFPGPSPSNAAPDGPILPLGVDMWLSSHATSLGPLSPSCVCYACTSHHRGFVQHLLSAKEMLGWTLLQIHNHSLLSSFFAAIRHSLASGTFERDCAEFERVYEPELPEKSGPGPRVRGYHFRSEGPSEPKRNKAAWGNLGPDGQVQGVGVRHAPAEPAGAAKLQEKGVIEKGED